MSSSTVPSSTVSTSTVGIGLRAQIESALAETLPEVSGALGMYRPVKRHGGQLWVSGQLPRWAGGLLFPGRLGLEVSVEEGRQAARCAALHVLAQVAHGLPEARTLDLLRLTVFVATGSGFGEHAQVADGASELFVQALGQEHGMGCRCAVGVATLPLGACVEVDAVFAVEV